MISWVFWDYSSRVNVKVSRIHSFVVIIHPFLWSGDFVKRMALRPPSQMSLQVKAGGRAPDSRLLTGCQALVISFLLFFTACNWFSNKPFFLLWRTRFIFLYCVTVLLRVRLLYILQMPFRCCRCQPAFASSYSENKQIWVLHIPHPSVLRCSCDPSLKVLELSDVST